MLLTCRKVRIVWLSPKPSILAQLGWVANRNIFRVALLGWVKSAISVRLVGGLCFPDVLYYVPRGFFMLNISRSLVDFSSTSRFSTLYYNSTRKSWENIHFNYLFFSLFGKQMFWLSTVLKYLGLFMMLKLFSKIFMKYIPPCQTNTLSVLYWILDRENSWWPV